MAIFYHFSISASITADKAKALLVDRLGAKLSDDGFVYTPDLLIAAGNVTPGRDTVVIEDAFHFTPSLEVTFRFIYDADGDEFDKLMLRATMLLLGHGGDAVLLFNGEIIVFQRLTGQLVFNTDYKIWDDEELLKREVPFPFERRSLPSPLL